MRIAEETPEISCPIDFYVPRQWGPTLVSGLLTLGLGMLFGWALFRHEITVRRAIFGVQAVLNRNPNSHSRLTLTLTELAVPMEHHIVGQPGAIGGGKGTATVDPHLLTLKRVAVPPIDILDHLLPLPSRDPESTFAGDPNLPQAPLGDGNPQGRGMGFGTGSGNGVGQGGTTLQGSTKARLAPQEWGVLKKVLPTYPPMALKRHIEGYVFVEVTIDGAGVPIRVAPIRGNTILMAACLRLLPLWRFEFPKSYGLSAPATFTVAYKFEIVAIE